MSTPRQLLPRAVYLITRRCLQRQFLLRPDPFVNSVFLYCLAVAAERFGIEIHAACVLSDHYHLLVTDVTGVLPRFMHWLNEYVAKILNARLGRRETFWGPGSYSAVRCVDEDAILDLLLYVYANPVAAGLVHRSGEWPGVWSSPDDLRRPGRQVNRPRAFFREGGSTPRSATLVYRAPEILKARFGDTLVAELKIRLAKRELEQQREFAASGRSFLGRKAVLDESTEKRASSYEAPRTLSPRIAARWRECRNAGLGELREFLRRYREALTEWLRGDRSMVFPAGTYLMRVRFGVTCAECARPG